MRISDWSSDVCSSDLNRHVTERGAHKQAADVFFSLEDVLTRMQDEGLLEPYRSPELKNFPESAAPAGKDYLRVKQLILGIASNKAYLKIGRASCRERVCQYV